MNSTVTKFEKSLEQTYLITKIKRIMVVLKYSKKVPAAILSALFADVKNLWSRFYLSPTIHSQRNSKFKCRAVYHAWFIYRLLLSFVKNQWFHKTPLHTYCISFWVSYPQVHDLFSSSSALQQRLYEAIKKYLDRYFLMPNNIQNTMDTISFQFFC